MVIPYLLLIWALRITILRLHFWKCVGGGLLYTLHLRERTAPEQNDTGENTSHTHWLSTTKKKSRWQFGWIDMARISRINAKQLLVIDIRHFSLYVSYLHESVRKPSEYIMILSSSGRKKTAKNGLYRSFFFFLFCIRLEYRSIYYYNIRIYIIIRPLRSGLKALSSWTRRNIF